MRICLWEVGTELLHDDARFVVASVAFWFAASTLAKGPCLLREYRRFVGPPHGHGDLSRGSVSPLLRIQLHRLVEGRDRAVPHLLRDLRGHRPTLASPRCPSRMSMCRIIMCTISSTVFES